VPGLPLIVLYTGVLLCLGLAAKKAQDSNRIHAYNQLMVYFDEDWTVEGKALFLGAK
jgi:hypothetical protein